MSAAPTYTNEEGRQEVLDALDTGTQSPGRSRSRAGDSPPGDELTPIEKEETLTKIADETQPDEAPPDLTRTVEEEFRGHTFEFGEFGDDVIEGARFEADAGEDADVEAAEFAYRVIGEKCRTPGADEDYWRQYDLWGDDGVMDLFERLIAGDEDVENLR